ncbi:DNA ligase D [Peribacillus alkalitolerans]|uniref:DNA ligase D n=1 Tax=Peribacillus alkalitolerans TaxID=1550385 RepID=UPI0013D7258E|nr:DNA ligase D [Peribacillus alkalitolerans]
MKLKPMLPTAVKDVPKTGKWLFETKYDGFRCLLIVSKAGIKLLSRNGKDLSHEFPELVQSVACLLGSFFHSAIFDGEIVWLSNGYKSDFLQTQYRGRLKKQDTINKEATHSPCQFMCFDLLELNGKTFFNVPLTERKNTLLKWFETQHLSTDRGPNTNQLIQYVPYDSDDLKLWELLVLHDAEGMIMKRADSLWEEGVRTRNWLKIKNKKSVDCFLYSYNRENGYFDIGVFHNNEMEIIGRCKNGLTQQEHTTLSQAVMANAYKQIGEVFYIEPSIVMTVEYLHIFDQELREPEFVSFQFEKGADQCTWKEFIANSATFSDLISVTSPDKPIYPTIPILKSQYLDQMRNLSSWMLPFLTDKPLTVIRYPHGVGDERFFQKNCPDYAPDFVQTYTEGGTDFILCNDLKTLVWLSNQLSLEFHVPYQKAGSTMPDEIVLDLDPETKDQFPLAVKAATLIKKALDGLKLESFIKTSGNRGLQIHIPIQPDTFTYEETRMFTDFLSQWLLESEPDDFTVERLKKNRGNKLYLDFVQHAEGKTIIAPYSPRGNDFAGVAAPLFWHELNEGIQIENYTLKTIYERIKKMGCPFSKLDRARERQPFKEIIDLLKLKNLK